MNEHMRDQILKSSPAKQLAMRQIADFLLWVELTHGGYLKADTSRFPILPARHELLADYVCSEKVTP